MLKKGLKKLNLFYPQWQGSGPDPAVYHGGLELKNYFSPALNFAEIKVSLSPAAPVKNAIFAYADLLRQMQETASLLGELWPQTIFTLGGGCDAGIIPVAWLNAYYAGELTVIWFDAHGDLNTPVSSPSGYFYGMPVRHLLGEGDKKIISPKIQFFVENISLNQIIFPLRAK